MKAEKMRKFIKCSFPKQPPLLLTLNSEMTKIYVDALNEELDELERLSEIGELAEKVDKNKYGIEVIWIGPFNEAKDDAEAYCGNCEQDINVDDWNYCPNCGVKLLIHGRDIS